VFYLPSLTHPPTKHQHGLRIDSRSRVQARLHAHACMLSRAGVHTKGANVGVGASPDPAAGRGVRLQGNTNSEGCMRRLRELCVCVKSFIVRKGLGDTPPTAHLHARMFVSSILRGCLPGTNHAGKANGKAISARTRRPLEDIRVGRLRL